MNMKRNRQTVKYWIADFCSVSIAWLVFNVLRYEKQAVFTGAESLTNYLSYERVIEGQIFIPICWLLLSFFVGYYEIPIGKSRLNEFFSTMLTSFVATIFVFFGMVLNDLPHDSYVYYLFLFSLFFLFFIFTYTPRLLLTLEGIKKIKTGEWSQSVLIIGTGNKAKRIARDLFPRGYSVYGYVCENKEAEVDVDPHEIIGQCEDIPKILAGKQVDEIVIAVESIDDSSLVKLLYSLYPYKLPIKILSDRLGMVAKVRIRTAIDIPLVDVTGNNFSALERNIKFLMDKVISSIALLLLSPLFLYIAWKVKRDSSGPVFFKQERIGFRGRPFMIYKFRTMYPDAEIDGPRLSSENDKRITPFGHFMRKYRLDELPQFWNVLKGDMSLVGPRPERRYFIEKIVEKAPYYYLLHNVRPGITSLGMVKYGYAGDVDKMIERLAYDVLYYENMSLGLDITILIYTVQTVITGKGV